MAGILKVDKYQDFNGNDIMTSDGSGNLTLNNAALKNTPAFSVQPSSEQSVPANTWTKVNFGTEVFDTDNAFASDKFTVPSGKDGKYCFTASVTIASNDDKVYSIKLYKNGSNLDITFYRQVTGGGSSIASTATTHVLDLNATDYIEVYINHSSVSSKNIQNVNTKFQGYKLIGA